MYAAILISVRLWSLSDLVLHRAVVPLCCYPEMRRVCGLKGCFTAGLRALQVPLPNSLVGYTF